jgi:hypothetical protein
MKSPAVRRAGQVSGRERTPKGRIAAEGLSRFAVMSDFDFSMGVFQNEKAPRESKPPADGGYANRSRKISGPSTVKPGWVSVCRGIGVSVSGTFPSFARLGATTLHGES